MRPPQAALGIIAALPAEARCLGARRPYPSSCHQLSANTTLRVCGMGQANASQVARQFVTDGADALMSWGFCGALTSDLQTGTLVLPLTLVAADGRVVDRVDAAWHQRLQQRLTTAEGLLVTTAALVTADATLCTAVDKHNLHYNSAAVAVDMESAAIATVARQAGLPFTAVRSISDTADTALPSTAAAMLDGSGQLHPLRGFGHWLGHPQHTGAMLELARGARRASRSLRTAAQLIWAQDKGLGTGEFGVGKRSANARK